VASPALNRDSQTGLTRLALSRDCQSNTTGRSGRVDRPRHTGATAGRRSV